MSHYYIIADYASRKDQWEFVSAVDPSSDPEALPDVWTTPLPYKWDGEKREPVRFAKRSDAVRILDALRTARLAYWEEHGYMLRARYGQRRPVWKIYKISG